MNDSIILLTGATGYIGGRLLRVLQETDLSIRCMARSPERLSARTSSSTEVVKGDVLDEVQSLTRNMKGVDCAFYLIHALGAAKNFEEQELQGAKNFATAAKEAGVKKIIYLGGLGSDSETLSPHLATRHEVGRLLASTGIPVIELRASIILGSGSLSFEMIRALTEHLPFMITPKWVSVKAQPIFIGDILSYLTESLNLSITGHEIIEIGGADVLSYKELMVECATQRGLKRMMIPVPFLTPKLSSLWLGLVTPLYARIGRKLIDSIEHPTVVTDSKAKKLFPEIDPVTASEAIRQALANEDQAYAETKWTDSLSSTGLNTGYGGIKYGNRLIDHRETLLSATPEDCFKEIEQIGGDNGWPAFDGLWRVRGFIDLLLGGVGMRRGRPQRAIRVGDPLDFWRVEKLERPNKLLLKAEMKVPGRAWLEFEVEKTQNGSKLSQTAIFDPLGIFGPLYWYGIYPIHGLVFRGMIQSLARKIESSSGQTQNT